MKRFMFLIFVIVLSFILGCTKDRDSEKPASEPGETVNPQKTVDLNKEKINVFVSILPQKYFVERVGGDYVNVSVLVGPGQSPATYEPTPQQMTALANADVYFRIGVPFEDAWIDKIAQVNPRMKIIDTREGITLRKMESHHHEESGTESHHDGEMMDPHIWLSPHRVAVQARMISDNLSNLKPEQTLYFNANFKSFFIDLDSMSTDIQEKLKNVTTKKFMVFHPSWGYFADEFDLEQIPIEIEGKEPNARELAEIIDLAKHENLKVIFVQTQFSQKSAQAIAEKIGAKVVTIDPLAENYIENMSHIADVLSSELK